MFKFKSSFEGLAFKKCPASTSSETRAPRGPPDLSLTSACLQSVQLWPPVRPVPTWGQSPLATCQSSPATRRRERHFASLVLWACTNTISLSVLKWDQGPPGDSCQWSPAAGPRHTGRPCTKNLQRWVTCSACKTRTRSYLINCVLSKDWLIKRNKITLVRLFYVWCIWLEQE